MAKLLIVDDEVDVREFAKNFFRKRGVTVFTAANGEEALGIVSAETPDLVLLDIRMDGMDGLEATRAITQQYPGIRVVIVTQYADRVLRDEAIAAGAVGFVSKSSLQDLSVHIV